MSVSKFPDHKTKDGRMWRFMCWVDGKKYSSKMYMTKKEAQEAEAQFIIDHSHKDLEAKRITFDDAIKEYLENEKQNTKPSTYRQEVKLCEHISHCLGPVKIEKLTVEQYKKFRNYLDDLGFSVAYKNKIVNHCKSVIRIVNNRYGCSTRVPGAFKPYSDKSIKKEMEFYTIDEFRSYISVIDDQVMRCFFLVLFFCALRCGENNGLDWNSVDLEKGTISIRRTVNTKMRDSAGNYLITSPKTSSSVRCLPLPKHCLEALKNVHSYWSKFEGFSNDWFVYGGPTAIPESTLHKLNDRYAMLSGQKHIRLHDFRHSAVAYYISFCNADILMVSHLLGHSDVEKTLNVYGHFYPSKLDALVRFSDNLKI